MDYLDYMKIQLGSTTNLKFPEINFNLKTDIGKYTGFNSTLATKPPPIPTKLPSITPKLGLEQGKVMGAMNEVKAKPTGAGIAAVGSIASALVPKYQSENKTTQIANSAYDTASNAVMAVNPLIGGIMKAGGATYDLINNLTGGALAVNNQKAGGAAKVDSLLSSKWLGLTPIGMANSLAKKTIEGSDTDIAGKVTGGYTPTEALASNEFGGFSRLFNKKGISAMSNRVANINTENAIKGNVIANANKDIISAKNNYSNIVGKNYQQLMEGNSPAKLRTLVAKAGMKFPLITKEKEINGVNVIPDGALHARKNNIDENIKEFVTDKGIPVVSGGTMNNGVISVEEGGKIVQTAEIERDEIIFHKKLTDKIEQLYKKYKETNDDNVLIEAGKLLTYEILENTEDNTNLINTI